MRNKSRSHFSVSGGKENFDIDKLYQVYIEYVRHENELLNHRTNWIITAQSLFLLAIGYIVQNNFESIILAINNEPDDPILKTIEFYIEFFTICGTGLYFSYWAKNSISAANIAQKCVARRWRNLVKRIAKHDCNILLYPQILGGGSKKAQIDGAKFPSMIVYFAVFFWSLAILAGAASAVGVSAAYCKHPEKFTPEERSSPALCIFCITTTAPASQ